MPDTHPLRGRVALVTGVSRRIGIGYALARKLASLGADVLAHSWAAHDTEQPWGADPAGEGGVVDHLRVGLAPGSGRVAHRAGDLAEATEPAAAVDATSDTFGGIDILVAAHARSSDHDLAGSSATELDLCWAVNTRATPGRPSRGLMRNGCEVRGGSKRP